MKSLVCVGFALTLAACSSKHATARVAAVPPTPTEASTSEVHSAPSSPVVDAGQAASGSRALPTQLWLDAPYDTRGTIACVDKRCRAGTEACVLGSPSRCVPTSPDKAYGPHDYSVYECDEGSDCPPGSACCESHMGGGYCQPRVGGAPAHSCVAELCLPDVGASCPAGEICVVNPNAEIHLGNCETRPVRATCTHGKRCSASAGAYVWTHATARGVCSASVDEEALDAGTIGVFGCTRPSDCGSGQRCCTSAQDSRRGAGCQPTRELASSMLLCSRDVDCQSSMQEPYNRAKCVPVSSDSEVRGELPPWISACKFDTE